MDTTTMIWIALAVAATLIVGGLFGVVLGRRQRTKKLQEKFGPEYEHIINERGDQRQAEHELAARLEHVNALEIRPFSKEEIDGFASEWWETQAEFVDAPLAAVQKADELIAKVMRAKGYPVEDFEQGAADISVSYPDLVMDYRGLHLIAIKGPSEIVVTEEMRKAMLHGRALFENLVWEDENETEVEEEKEKVQ